MYPFIVNIHYFNVEIYYAILYDNYLANTL